MAAVFFDLNGTLVLPVQADSLSDYIPIPGAFAAIRLLNQSGFVCPVVTVQSRIEKGMFSEAEFRSWFRSFVAEAGDEGAHIAGLYLCPHRVSSNCPCGKPKPTLYRQAAGELGVDSTRSYVIGDTASDIEAAGNIGATGCLVLTGWGRDAIARAVSADYVGRDLHDVATWIISRSEPKVGAEAQ
jgi:D-glycero-D-manno-heptose 1,7-bisphosphate phosphatase